jgi:hypothetical protein
VYAYFIGTVAKCVLDFSDDEISAAFNQLDTAYQTLIGDPDWKKYQLPYWRLSFDIMYQSAAAWKLYRIESFEAGIQAMLTVINFQMSTWAPEVGHMWDPHEQLAEMYLLRSSGTVDVENALAAYEAALAVYPNRYHALAGAGKCADLLNNNIKASRYYGDLLTLTGNPLPQMSLAGVSWPQCPTYQPNRRPGLVEANAYFAAIDANDSNDDDDDSRINFKNGAFRLLLFVVVGLLGIGLIGWLLYSSYKRSQLGKSAMSVSNSMGPYGRNGINRGAYNALSQEDLNPKQ